MELSIRRLQLKVRTVIQLHILNTISNAFTFPTNKTPTLLLLSNFPQRRAFFLIFYIRHLHFSPLSHTTEPGHLSRCQVSTKLLPIAVTGTMALLSALITEFHYFPWNKGRLFGTYVLYDPALSFLR